MSHLFITPSSSDIFTLDLSSRLGRGATANVYKVSILGQFYAVKIYNQPQRVDWTKLTAMTELGQRKEYQFVKTHAWPVGIIQENGRNIGFAMPLYDLGLFQTLDHYYDNILRTKVIDTKLLALPNLILIAKNICFELQKLHEKQIYLIDIKPQNIVVNTTTNEIILLDCDGFSVEKDGSTFPGTLISADYISPEVTINKLSPSKLGLSQDLYGLAVLIFQLLNRGLHPYSGRHKSSISASTNDDKAAIGIYGYGAAQNEIIAPHVSSLHLMWPKSILDLFEKCFTGGERAQASEWVSLFENIERNKGFVRCEKLPNDFLHIRFRDQGCMQCKIDGLQVTHGVPKSNDGASKPNKSYSYIPPQPPPETFKWKAYASYLFVAFLVSVFFIGKTDNALKNTKDSYVSVEKPSDLQTTNAKVGRDFSVYSDQALCQILVDVKSKYEWNRERIRRNLNCVELRNTGQKKAVSRPFKSYSDELVCINVAETKSAAHSVWKTEASLRNLDCGASNKPLSTANKKCSLDNLKMCPVSTICTMATDGNPRRWRTGDKWAVEAKRRGYSCGVKGVSEVKDLLYRNVDIFGSDLIPAGIWDVSQSKCIALCKAFDGNRCKAISYVPSTRSCWLKPKASGLSRRSGVNTVTIGR